MTNYWDPVEHHNDHPDFPADLWLAEVNSDATRLGYVEWVNARLHEIQTDDLRPKTVIRVVEKIDYLVPVAADLTDPVESAIDIIEACLDPDGYRESLWREGHREFINEIN